MKNIEKHIRISHLLWKNLKNELSDNERLELNLLFEENPKFKKWFANFQKQSTIEKQVEEFYSIDINEKWNQLYPKIKNRNRFRISMQLLWRGAAIFIALLGIYILVDQIYFDTEMNNTTSEILPGSTKAMLTLSDGSKINLQKDSLQTIYDVGNIINSNGRELQYNPLAGRTENKEQLELNKIDVPRGGEFRLVLNDGTKVILNSETSLKYQVPFGTKNRMIELIKGEAFFEVAHNKELPFRVLTKEGLITAIGTSFNVRSYEHENNTYTTLAEGKVSIKTPDESIFYLTSGKQAVINKNSHELNILDVDLDRYLMWKDGEFIFENDRLEVILSDLARWYNFEVFYDSESLKDLKFSFYLERDKGIYKILELLKKTKSIEFDVSGNYILVKRQ